MISHLENLSSTWPEGPRVVTFLPRQPPLDPAQGWVSEWDRVGLSKPAWTPSSPVHVELRLQIHTHVFLVTRAPRLHRTASRASETSPNVPPESLQIVNSKCPHLESPECPSLPALPITFPEIYIFQPPKVKVLNVKVKSGEAPAGLEAGGWVVAHPQPPFVPLV